jgi:DNA-directed RNA polymerase specialized sigma24 family protein
MQRHLYTDQPLDAIAARARSGDRAAEQAFFEALRVRFLAIAKRRVRRDDQEDVVQDALRVIHAKYRETEPQARALTWAMVVLRNVIGNYYQKRKRLDRGEPFEDRIHGATESGGNLDGSGHRILEAIGLLAQRHPRCGALFRAILEQLAEGGDQRQMSRDTIEQLGRDLGDLSRNALYVALHRCRARLREIMREIERVPPPGEVGNDAASRHTKR